MKLKDSSEKGVVATLSSNQENFHATLAASIQAEEQGGLTKTTASKCTTAAVPCQEDGEEDDEEMILRGKHGEVDQAVLFNLPPSLQRGLFLQTNKQVNDAKGKKIMSDQDEMVIKSVLDPCEDQKDDIEVSLQSDFLYKKALYHALPMEYVTIAKLKKKIGEQVNQTTVGKFIDKMAHDGFVEAKVNQRLGNRVIQSEITESKLAEVKKAFNNDAMLAEYGPPFFRCGSEEEARNALTKNNLKMEVGNVNSKHPVFAPKGTTAFAYICGNLILVAVDSRSMFGNIDFVHKHDYIKLRQVKHNIVAAMLGDAQECKNLLDFVDTQFERHDISDDVNMADAYARSYVGRWECKGEPNKIFPSSILLVGFGVNKEPLISHINIGKPEYRSYDGGYYIGGSGASQAFEHFKLFQENNTTKDDVLKIMKQSLAAAALQDKSTGGWLHIWEVRPYGSQEVYNQEFLQVLVDHYDSLEYLLSKMVFSLWFDVYHRRDQAYYNVIKGRMLCLRFKQFHEIAQKRTCVIRALSCHLKQQADIFYDEARKVCNGSKPSVADYAHLRLDIPKEILELPRIQVEGYPVVLLKPTKQLLELLKDV